MVITCTEFPTVTIANKIVTKFAYVYMHCVVDVNKMFAFYFCSTSVLQCDRGSKHGVKSLLC